MKLQELKIEENEGFLGTTYTFILEQKRLKREKAEEKIQIFEKIVDNLYKEGNIFKTKSTGDYIEIKETNSKTINAHPNQEGGTKNITAGTIRSHIKYEPRRIFKKATITITNEGNNPQKIKYFNDEIKNMKLETNKQAETQIQKLEQIIQKYN